MIPVILEAIGLATRGAAAAEGVAAVRAGASIVETGKTMSPLLRSMAIKKADQFFQKKTKEQLKEHSQTTLDRIMEQHTPVEQKIPRAINEDEYYFGGRAEIIKSPLRSKFMNTMTTVRPSNDNDVIREMDRGEYVVDQLSPILESIDRNTFMIERNLESTTDFIRKFLEESDLRHRRVSSNNIERVEEHPDKISESIKSSPERTIETSPKEEKKESSFIDKAKNIGIGVAKAVGGAVTSVVGNVIENVGKAFGGRDREAANKISSTPKQNKKPEVLQGRIGVLSEAFESGGNGVATVSSGRNDPKGGVSYGKWQIASGRGPEIKGKGVMIMDDFMKSKEASKFASEFKGLIPGTQPFTAKYKEFVKTRGAEMERAQFEYLKRGNFDRPYKEAQSLGFPVKNGAFREAVWSASMHFGPGQTVQMLRSAAKEAGDKKGDPRSAINALYDARWNKLQGKAGDSQSVRNRLVEERDAAISLLDTGQAKVKGNIVKLDGNGQKGPSRPNLAMENKGSQVYKSSTQEAAKKPEQAKVIVRKPVVAQTPKANNNKPSVPSMKPPSAKPDGYLSQLSNLFGIG